MPRFHVSYKFRAASSETINADDLESAEALIEAKAYRDEFDPHIEDIDDVEFDVQEMHPVTRAGREIWTTFVSLGDIRGHQSAIDNAPLFSGIPEREAAPAGAVG